MNTMVVTKIVRHGNWDGRKTMWKVYYWFTKDECPRFLFLIAEDAIAAFVHLKEMQEGICNVVLEGSYEAAVGCVQD